MRASTGHWGAMLHVGWARPTGLLRVHRDREAGGRSPLCKLHFRAGESTIPPMPVTLETIRAARERIKDVIYHSACNYSLSLSRLCNAEIHCKLDHLQVTGSF